MAEVASSCISFFSFILCAFLLCSDFLRFRLWNGHSMLLVFFVDSNSDDLHFLAPFRPLSDYKIASSSSLPLDSGELYPSFDLHTDDRQLLPPLPHTGDLDH